MAHSVEVAGIEQIYSGVEGGVTRNVAKGDFFIVPEGVPHWFSRINGTLVLMSLHVPHQMGNPR